MRSPLVLASRILGRSNNPAPAHSRRRKARLMLEHLERREVLSTFMWTGGGLDGNWDNSANWQGGQAPTSGPADIVFPSTASPVTITLPTQHDQLSVTAITVQGGSYTLQGPMADSLQKLNVADGATITTPSGSTLAIAPNRTTSPDANSLPLNFQGGVTKSGPGTLALNNDLFFPTSPSTLQSFHVSGGTVAIGASATLGGFRFQIDSGAAVFVADGFSPSLGSLTGGGTLQVGANQATAEARLLTPAGVSDHFTGVINGSGGLVHMLGQGILDVGSINPGGTGTFDLTVAGGMMLLDSASSVRQLQVFASPTQTVAFGNLSTLQVSGAASFTNSATLDVALNGTGPGQSTRLNSANPVDLGGSTLSVAPLGYTPSAGDTFTILSSPGGITGQFANVMNGQNVTVNNVSFRYNQTASTATLTALPAPAPTATTTTLTSTVNPSVAGQSVTFTATVQGGGAAVTSGSVTFAVDGTPRVMSPLNSSGTAAFAISLSAGPHSIVATYNPTVAYAASTSAALPQTVIAPPSVIGFKAVFTQKRNAKGKPVGRPVFSGFEFDFSTTMNSSEGSSSNYTMGAFVTKRQGRKNVTVLQPTGFSVSVISASSVLLKPSGRQTFPKGGQITLNAGGLFSSANAALAGRTTFSISRGGKSIS
jgi:hypothetical protein